jgi:hypothetical protein
MVTHNPRVEKLISTTVRHASFETTMVVPQLSQNLAAIKSAQRLARAELTRSILISDLNPGVRHSLTPDGKSITYGTGKSTSNLG